MTDQPYQTPKSDVQVSSSAATQFGSAEKAISGNYSFEIGEILQEAWDKTKGTKGSIIAACAIIYAIAFGLTFITGLATSKSTIMPIVFQIIITIIIMPMYIGLIMIGVRRAIEQPVTFTMIFQYFGFIVPLLLTTLLLYVLVAIGFVLLVIPGIYLSVSYTFALLLVIEKKMGIWEALETSRKAVTHRWFSLFFFWIIMTVIILISMIPIGIGLIWTIPMGCIAYGIIYRNIFGIEPVQL